MLQAQLFTLYPEVFPGPLNKGLYGKALAKNLWSLNVINIRDAAKDKKEEEPKAEAKKEEAPKAEAKKEEAPKAEAKKEEAPKAEAVPKEEKK